MKILVITDLYPISENESNTPKTIYNFVKYWQKRNHDIKVVKPNFLLNSFLRRKPFYKTGIYYDVENINFFTPFWGNIKQKIRTLDNFEPDIVVAHMPSGIITAKKLGYPFIAGVHISDIEVLTNPIYSIHFKKELEKGYEQATVIACRSEILRKKFLELYPQYNDKTFVCYSGINQEIITKGYWKNNKKVLTCAQLKKRKNIDKVILECSKAGVELTVVGNGDELANLRRLAKKNKYENIKFVGHISHTKVLELMRESDIFALPSINETFGMVYLEAMASGCITVCTQNDGADGIIKDGYNGFYWENGIINKILNIDSQNMILENSHKTILNYTEESAGENYLEIINNAIRLSSISQKLQ